MLSFNLEKRLVTGNSIELLRDGEGFYPRLIERIDAAEKEMLLETFILADDEVGQNLKQALIRAARRDVKIVFTVDSWGSFYLPQAFIDEMTCEGIVVQIYDPQPSWLKARPKMVNRLHRKLVVVDGERAFVGGINFSDDHLTENNPAGKRDYVAEVTGPIVKHIRKLCVSNVEEQARDALDHKLGQSLPETGNVTMAFVSRENWKNRADIEKAYLEKIKQAERRILIANAYLYPSYRLVRALRKAAKRGVDVRVITQGKPDLAYTRIAAHSIFKKLIVDGVKMYEYIERPLHGKIAAIDDEWCTIGSSNLDPFSLGANLEANLVIQDSGVNTKISRFIEDLIEHSDPINMRWVKHRPILGAIRDTALYHALRWWPAITNRVATARPRVKALHQPVEPRVDNTSNSISASK